MTDPVDLEELASRLFADEEADAAGPTASELILQSFQAANGAASQGDWPFPSPVPGASRLDLRLHGRAIDGHVAPVRLAARALTVMQDLVSVVGMAQRGKKSLSGAVPTEILEATQLNLSPAAAPGSLIFEMRGTAPVVREGELSGAHTGVNLADTAAAEIFALLRRAAGDDEGLRAELQRLGPRVSSHFRRLSALTITEGLLLDMRWEQGNGQTIEGQLQEASAVELDRVITESRTSREPETLHGHLITISTEDKLVLRDRGGSRISLVEAEEFVQNSADFYNKDVVAYVEVEVEAHPTTGRDVRTYHLTSLRLESDDEDPQPTSLDF